MRSPVLCSGSQELMLKKKMLGRGGGGADRMRDRNIEPDCE